MARHKDVNWNLPDPSSWEATHAALLMDIRDELKRLNNLLYCSNFTAIPETLRGIRRKLPTQKPQRRSHT